MERKVKVRQRVRSMGWKEGFYTKPTEAKKIEKEKKYEMLHFRKTNEIKEKGHTQNIFGLFEDEVLIAEGMIKENGNTLFLSVLAGCEQNSEFVFRSLLNVARLKYKKTVCISSELYKKHGGSFSFTKANAGYIIKSEDINFICKCKE